MPSCLDSPRRGAAGLERGPMRSPTLSLMIGLFASARGDVKAFYEGIIKDGRKPSRHPHPFPHPLATPAPHALRRLVHSRAPERLITSPGMRSSSGTPRPSRFGTRPQA